MSSKPGEYGIEKLLERNWFRPTYWRTLANLRADTCSIVHEGSSLRFADYAFEPSSVFPSGRIQAHDVVEVNLDHPPQVRLSSGEILFAPHTGKEAFMSFINANSPLGEDIWTG
jgi:hypothetical protein